MLRRALVKPLARPRHIKLGVSKLGFGGKYRLGPKKEEIRSLLAVSSIAKLSGAPTTSLGNTDAQDHAVGCSTHDAEEMPVHVSGDDSFGFRWLQIRSRSTPGSAVL